jgi:hypothetical protein
LKSLEIFYLPFVTSRLIEYLKIRHLFIMISLILFSGTSCSIIKSIFNQGGNCAMAGNLAVCDLTSTTWSGDKCVKSVTNHINPTRTKIYELYKQKCCDSSASWNICGSGTIWQNNLCTADDDNDGVPNSRDTCPGTPAGETVNSNGCSLNQLDAAQATCAQITDGTAGGPFVCGTGFTLQSIPEGIDCGATPCLTKDDSTQKGLCCSANAQGTCADSQGDSTNTAFVCGTGYTLRASPENINCGQTPCLTKDDSTQKGLCCTSDPTDPGTGF